VAGLIDFGDMCETWRVAELAITATYAMLAAVEWRQKHWQTSRGSSVAYDASDVGATDRVGGTLWPNLGAARGGAGTTGAGAPVESVAGAAAEASDGAPGVLAVAPSVWEVAAAAGRCVLVSTCRGSAWVRASFGFWLPGTFKIAMHV
jgi:hypothetical protein